MRGSARHGRRQRRESCSAPRERLQRHIDIRRVTPLPSYRGKVTVRTCCGASSEQTPLKPIGAASLGSYRTSRDGHHLLVLGRLPRNKKRHSITSSTSSKNASGIFSPMALAVLRFTINSYRVGSSNGRSAGFAPLRIRCTSLADWR